MACIELYSFHCHDKIVWPGMRCPVIFYYIVRVLRTIKGRGCSSISLNNKNFSVHLSLLHKHFSFSITSHFPFHSTEGWQWTRAWNLLLVFFNPPLTSIAVSSIEGSHRNQVLGCQIAASRLHDVREDLANLMRCSRRPRYINCFGVRIDHLYVLIRHLLKCLRNFMCWGRTYCLCQAQLHKQEKRKGSSDIN